MQLTACVYKATQQFPSEERFGLTNQLRRAAVSIPSNIAEGRGRTTRGEMIQFLGMARGSALELQTQLEIAMMLELGTQIELNESLLLAQEIDSILTASILTMRSNHPRTKSR